MAQFVIARAEEKRELLDLYKSGRPEFIILRGRRRVGKTFLVREMFSKEFAFYHTGLSPFELEDNAENLARLQLDNFYSTLLRFGYEGARPANWFKAFDALIELLEEKSVDNKRLVVFIDELPWMDTPRSGFLTAFEHFWNGWGAGNCNLMLIVCGSSNSWVSDKLINNKGGLYNRSTYEICLNPLTLKECEEFYHSMGITFCRYDQVQAYMMTGGVPYYLSLMKKGKSLSLNIDDLCFSKKAKLKNEFDRLFRSAFSNANECIKIVRLLATHRDGYTRKEIAEKAQLPYGGGLSASIKALEESGFIYSYIPYGKTSRSTTYKLIDLFCLFYLSFMDKSKTTNQKFWHDNLLTGSLNAWRGFAFENVCFCHLKQIKAALGVQGVRAEASPWRGSADGESAQIDMVIDRADYVVNICEIKYNSNEFRIDKQYDKELRRKVEIISGELNRRKTLQLTLITTYGLIQNEYSGRIQNLITMDDLF